MFLLDVGYGVNKIVMKLADFIMVLAKKAV